MARPRKAPTPYSPFGPQIGPVRAAANVPKPKPKPVVRRPPFNPYGPQIGPGLPGAKIIARGPRAGPYATRPKPKPAVPFKQQPIVRIKPQQPRPRPPQRTGTAATIPQHAKTPAVASTRAVTATAVAHAQAGRKTPPIGVSVMRPPRPARRPTAAPPTTKPTPTTTPTDDMAALIDSILKPQYAAIDAAIAREQETNRQNLATYAGLTRSYLSSIRDVPANVAADYGAMMQQTGQMAQTSAERLAAASPNADVQAMLQSVGAPESQQAQLATQNQNIFAGGGAVLGHTQGTIPGETLARVGAAQTAYAHELPAVVAARGAQGLQSLEYQFGRNLQPLWEQRAAVAGQVPKLTLDIRNQQIADEMKRKQLEIEAKLLGPRLAQAKANVAATKARTAQGWARVKISKGNLKVRQQTAKTSAAKAQLASDFRYAEIYGYNPTTGQPTLAAIKASRADKAKGRKPPSATQRKNWTTFADQAYHGIAQKTHYDSSSGTFIKDPTTGTPPIQYYPALKRLMSMGATLTQAQKTLNALYAKGEGGRPYVSLQGRVALEQAGMPLAHPMDVPDARQRTYLQNHRLWSD